MQACANENLSATLCVLSNSIIIAMAVRARTGGKQEEGARTYIILHRLHRVQIWRQHYESNIPGCDIHLVGAPSFALHTFKERASERFPNACTHIHTYIHMMRREGKAVTVSSSLACANRVDHLRFLLMRAHVCTLYKRCDYDVHVYAPTSTVSTDTSSRRTLDTRQYAHGHERARHYVCM